MANFVARKWPECRILHHLSQGFQGPSADPLPQGTLQARRQASYARLMGPLQIVWATKINLVGDHLAPKIFPQLQTLKVEDEHHFLIECAIYNSVRDKFFTLFNRKCNETTEVTINRLLNPSSIQDLNNICLYLKESYSLRDSTFKNI